MMRRGVTLVFFGRMRRAGFSPGSKKAHAGGLCEIQGKEIVRMNETIDLYAEMREACAAILDRHGVGREHMNFAVLISRVQIRNCLVRHEYRERREPGNSEGVKEELARSFGIGNSYVERILYGE